MYAISIDPESFEVSTNYLANVKIHDGKGETIFNEVSKFLDISKIDRLKVMGLGTDSANVMVGEKRGLAGRMKGVNPMMISVGCIAHKLALAVSQAADKIEYLKIFQETLTSIFYYFKN